VGSEATIFLRVIRLKDNWEELQKYQKILYWVKKMARGSPQGIWPGKPDITSMLCTW